jgi:uncharacterized damage-inducible protein DinB
MYQKIKDFLEDWKEEFEATIKVFSNIPDSVNSVKDNENIRSLDRMAWHITQTVTEMPKSCGIIEDDPLEGMDIPTSFSKIIDLYKKHGSKLYEILEQNWTDADLTRELKIYGQTWQGRKILSILIKHQIHHRAQMTILMRLQNLKVPGIYGPSREEWSQYGMEAQE